MSITREMIESIAFHSSSNEISVIAQYLLQEDNPEWRDGTDD